VRPDRSIPRALPRPTLAVLVLAIAGLLASREATVAGDDATATPDARATAGLGLGTPVPPADPADAEEGVGLVALATHGDTLAGLRSDGRILVRTGASERVFAAPADAGAFRVLAVAGDGVVVVVTTHGRLVLLEPGGARVLPLAVQRSAKPATIPDSRDVALGSENGSIRRLVRGDREARLEDVVPSGDEPVGALAATADRVVYARLDGVVLEASFAGGPPRELARPARAVSVVHVVGTKAFVLEGGALVTLDTPSPAAATTRAAPATPRPSTDARVAPDASALAVSRDGAFAAFVVGDAIEVRRLADGASAVSKALASRTPTALVFADDRTLLVATRADARPWRVAIQTPARTPR